ncbi:hypothetical protein HK100_010810 [Physocladia obscura]|uniref:Cysteine dioxygenase n=1 Tax=Physocladia obscura TaxID=109957 RepID=A0AAD5XM93_9FUNG|nr:hypothetical protein HK100_010810 [Physocladia obscura]
MALSPSQETLGAEAETETQSQSDNCKQSGPQTLAELVTFLHAELGSKGLHEMHTIDIARVQAAMGACASDIAQWRQYRHFDSGRYTRNLVDAGNGRFNLMILCWPAGVASPIHDHAGSHCLMKIMEGELKETRYAWPQNSSPSQQAATPPLPLIPNSLLPSITAQSAPITANTSEVSTMSIIKETTIAVEEVAYIHDKIGLHRISNPTSSDSVSLHLYCPPYETCKTFEEKTSKCRGSGRAVFYSEGGILKKNFGK